MQKKALKDKPRKIRRSARFRSCSQPQCEWVNGKVVVPMQRIPVDVDEESVVAQRTGEQIFPDHRAGEKAVGSEAGRPPPRTRFEELASARIWSPLAIRRFFNRWFCWNLA